MNLMCGMLIARLSFVFLIVWELSACSSVTIRPNGGEKDHSEPTYMDSKAFYLLGFIGEYKVDVNEVCEGADVDQMQTVITVSDNLFAIATFAIYTPRTVKVWCKE